MRAAARATPVARDEAVYIVDNGAVYCGAHLGASARWTGYDISGQPILEVTPAMLDERDGWCRCETCGRQPI